EVLTDDKWTLRRGKQRVAVGIRLGDNLGAEVLRGTGPVLDNHGVRPFERELVGDNARQNVGRGTRRERHDDFDRSAGIDLSRSARDAEHGCQRHPQRQLSHALFNYLVSAGHEESGARPLRGNRPGSEADQSYRPTSGSAKTILRISFTDALAASGAAAS